MATQFKTWINHKEEGPQMQTGFSPSQTVPDQTMSLQQLLEKHVQGLPVPTFEGYGQEESDEFWPDPRSLDRTELADLQKANSKRIKELQNEAQSGKQRALAQKAAEGAKPQTSDGPSEQQASPPTS